MLYFRGIILIVALPLVAYTAEGDGLLDGMNTRQMNCDAAGKQYRLCVDNSVGCGSNVPQYLDEAIRACDHPSTNNNYLYFLSKKKELEDQKKAAREAAEPVDPREGLLETAEVVKCEGADCSEPVKPEIEQAEEKPEEQVPEETNQDDTYADDPPEEEDSGYPSMTGGGGGGGIQMPKMNLQIKDFESGMDVNGGLNSGDEIKSQFGQVASASGVGAGLMGEPTIDDRRLIGEQVAIKAVDNQALNANQGGPAGVGIQAPPLVGQGAAAADNGNNRGPKRGGVYSPYAKELAALEAQKFMAGTSPNKNLVDNTARASNARITAPRPPVYKQKEDNEMAALRLVAARMNQKYGSFYKRSGGTNNIVEYDGKSCAEMVFCSMESNYWRHFDDLAAPMPASLGDK